MRKYYVYILRSQKDGRYYIGYTTNIERRLQEHNRGKNKSVRRRGPFEVVGLEAYPEPKRGYETGEINKKL
jgi:putative endonuclease